MAPTSCPQCQCASIEHEVSGAEEFYVCSECGTIIEDVNDFAHSYAAPCDSTLLVKNSAGALVVPGAPKSKKSGTPVFLVNSEYESRGKIRGIRKTKEFSQELHLPSDCCKDAVSLFSKTYHHADIINKSLAVKDIVSAACVYAAARKQNMPVTLTFMAEMTGVKLASLAWYYQFVVRVNEVSVPPLGMAALVVKTLTAKGLDKSVIEMTPKLLTLCHSAWISTGRHPDTCIPAAAFLCWLASDSCGSIKTNYASFCRKFNIPYTVRQREVVKVIRDVLKPMAEKIPWITKVDEKTLVAELPAIINHQTSLLKKAFASKDSEDDIKLLPLSMTKRKKQSEGDQEEEVANASEAAKRYKYLHSNTLDETEFADEMDQHLYSEEEVRDRKQFRYHLESQEPAAEENDSSES